MVGREENALRLVESVSVDRVERFVVNDFIMKEMRHGCFLLDTDFRLKLSGKIEENVHAGAVNIYCLEKSLPDSEIIKALGEKAGEPMALAHFFGILLRQEKTDSNFPYGSSNSPLYNRKNLMYVREGDLFLVVRADWNRPNWGISMYYSCCYPLLTPMGVHIFSRNSVAG